MLLPMPFIGTSHNSVVGKAMQSEHSVFSLPIIALMKNPSAVYLLRMRDPARAPMPFYGMPY